MKRFIENHNDEVFDILIIGGGITGAVVAYEAASRGLKVALIEKADFGGATSAATSKMIHGGFRYLTHFEIGLVRESLRERRILTNIAPNYVHPLPFVFTHYKGDKYPGWMVKLGLIFYDLLSFDKNLLWDKSIRMPWHRSLPVKELLNHEPEVLPDSLKGANLYYDCMNFYPERLTLAFIKSAVKSGAKVTNYAEVKDFLIDENKKIKTITGVKVFDHIRNSEAIIKSKLVLNCAGPWADIVLNKAIKNTENRQLRRSEGIHIITKKKVSNYVITATTKAGRHCFFVPWRGHALIGTTDKEFIGNPDDYRVTKKAIKELLDEVNPIFGRSEKIELKDVEFAYGGLRPLVEEDTKESYESSRKYEISNHKKDGIHGLLTVEGGKYTTSRNLARKVVDKVVKELNIASKKSISKNQFLSGCEIDNLKSYISEKQKMYPFLEKPQVEFLVKMYGTEIDQVIKIAGEDEALKKPLNADGEIAAQVVYAIRNEMALTLPDILFRRTGLGTLGHPGEDTLNVIARIAAKEAGWDEKRKSEEINKAEFINLIKEE